MTTWKRGIVWLLLLLLLLVPLCTFTGTALATMVGVGKVLDRLAKNCEEEAVTNCNAP